MTYAKETSKCYRIEPIVIKNKPGIINAKVSVIIPVKNGIATLPDLIKSIYGQKRIADIEIIVIDSESSDNSDRIAEQLGAKVVNISAKDFNHGLTRNLGASHASGDFFIFTVQDSLPKSPYTFYNLLLPFYNYSNLGAISGRQFVTDEADYYSRWVNEWIYAEEPRDRMVCLTQRPFETVLNSLDVGTKIRLSFFDNVFSAVRREVFEKIKFRGVEHGEDRDFGLRLLGSGHTLGFMRSTGVYHWHDRGPEYVLKRNYVGLMSFKEIFNWDVPQSIFPEGLSFKELISTANCFIEKLGTFLRELEVTIFGSLNDLDSYLLSLSQYLSKNDDLSNITGSCEKQNFLFNIFGNQSKELNIEINIYNILANTFSDHLNSFKSTFKALELKNANFLNMMSKGILNLLAHILGVIISYYVLGFVAQNKDLNEELRTIDRMLRLGI